MIISTPWLWHTKMAVDAMLAVETLNSQKKFDIKWHIKSINTGTYLYRKSFSLTIYKKSAVRALIFRAFKLSSSIQYSEDAFALIKYLFICNVYYLKFIKKIKAETSQKITKKSSTPKEETEKIKTVYF